MVKVTIDYRDGSKEEIECTYCKPQLGFFELGTRFEEKKKTLARSTFIPSDLILHVSSTSEYEPKKKRFGDD